MLIFLIRLPFIIMIAIPCYFLIPIFWVLGVKNIWGKMTRLFDELAFDN